MDELEQLSQQMVKDIEIYKILLSAGLPTHAKQGSIAMVAKRIYRMVSVPCDILRDDWTDLGEAAAWNLFLDWKAFDKIPVDRSISTSDLAQSLDAEETLVSRIASMLIASGRLVSPAPGWVAHSALSAWLRTQNQTSYVAWVAARRNMPFLRWPDYFSLNGRREPRVPIYMPVRSGWGRAGPGPATFDVSPEAAAADAAAFRNSPEYVARFSHAMAVHDAVIGKDPCVTGPGAPFDMAWIGEEARARAEQANGNVLYPSPPLVMNVGDRHGQLLLALLRKVEGLRPDMCIMQDRHEAVQEMIVADEPELRHVVKVAYDIQGRQPIRGAFVYFLRHVLPSHSDEAAAGILRRLGDAMPNDPRARVIIMDEQLQHPPNMANRTADLAMLNVGGKLRDEDTYRRLVHFSGLRFV